MKTVFFGLKKIYIYQTYKLWMIILHILFLMFLFFCFNFTSFKLNDVRSHDVHKSISF